MNIEQAREIARKIRYEAGTAYHGLAADAICTLIAELEKVTREAHENKDKARWANAELERVTTLARGQHVELYNAKLELERLKSQEPVAHLYIDSYGKVKLGQLMPPEEGSFPVYLAAGAQPTKSLKQLADESMTFGKKATAPVVKDSLTTQDPTPLGVRLVDILLGQAQKPFAPDWAGYRQGKADGIAEAQERKPLSEKQIHKLWKNLRSDDGIEEFARAIEQAHLIGEQP